MADRFFPNDLPNFVAEDPDGDDPPAGLRGLLSLPYPSLSDRLLRAGLQLKDKVRRAPRSVAYAVWVGFVAHARCSTD